MSASYTRWRGWCQGENAIRRDRTPRRCPGDTGAAVQLRQALRRRLRTTKARPARLNASNSKPSVERVGIGGTGAPGTTMLGGLAVHATPGSAGCAVASLVPSTLLS